MKVFHSICMCMVAAAFCAVLIACRSSKGTTSEVVENQFLMHYLDAATDSTKDAGKRKKTADQVGNLNRHRMKEDVNPQKEGTWGDILRNFLDFYWLNRK